MIGAGASIKVFAPLSSEWILPVDKDFLTYATESRLDRRYLVTSPTKPEPEEEAFLRRLHGLGWQVMWVNAPPSMIGLVIDDEIAYIASGPTRAFAIDSPDVIGGLVEHFERIWTVGKSRRNVQILFDDVLVTAGPQPTTRIQLDTKSHWDRLLVSLHRTPEDIYGIDPRRFEELVAELAQRDRPEGLVRLTPRSNDGGRDVMIFEDTAFGRHLFLIECKRYAPDRPIDVTLVRQLFGVVEGERASAGVLVTSSFFTGPAKAWPKEMKIEYRLGLKVFDDLGKWIRKHIPTVV